MSHTLLNILAAVQHYPSLKTSPFRGDLKTESKQMYVTRQQQTQRWGKNKLVVTRGKREEGWGKIGVWD